MINVLIEIKYFNLLASQTHSMSLTNPVLRKYFLAELFGFFELFQLLVNTEVGYRKNSLLSHNSLADGFRDTLTLMIRVRAEMDMLTLKNLIRIIYRIAMHDQNEVDYSQMIYDATLKVYKIEHAMRLEISQRSRSDTKVMRELQKAVVLRKGLTEVLVRSYILSKKNPTFDEQKDAKFNVLEFLNKLILELNEEEIKIKLAPQLLASNALTSFSLRSEPQSSAELGSNSIYRYLMRLIVEMCTQKADLEFFSHVFNLIVQKYPIIKLIQNYLRTSSPILKEYYMQMLILVGHMAGSSRSTELMKNVVNQVCHTLVNESATVNSRIDWTRVCEACSALLQTIYDTCSHDPDFVLKVYCLLASVYSSMRANDYPLDKKWVPSNRFIMSWLEKFHRYLHKRPEYITLLDKEGEATLQFWMFIIIDIEDLLKEDAEGFRNFSLTFTSLTEASEKSYSNSIMNYHIFLKEKVDVEVEPRLKRVVHNYYREYEKYLFLS